MLIALKGLARTLILPPCGPLILAILGVLLLRARRRGAWPLLIAGLALLWSLSMPWVADGLTRLAEYYPALTPAQAARGQAIVILGGPDDRFPAAEFGGQAAAEGVLLERLNYGAYLARRTSLPVLLTSTWVNSFAMWASLRRDFGIRAKWVDYRARDTFENARNSAAILHAANVHTIVLVTSSTHMLRATREFEAAGLTVLPAPCGVSAPRRGADLYSLVPTAQGLQRSNLAIYELLGERVREVMAALHLRRQSPQ